MSDDDGRKTLDEEIKDMEEMFEDQGLTVDPKDEVSESKKEEKETETETEETSKESKKSEEKPEETKEEKPEETEEESEEEELDPLKVMEAENIELRRKLNEASTPKKAEEETETETETKTETKEEKKEPEPEPIDEVDFVGELDLDNLTRDPVELNRLLNLVHQRGVQTARTEARTGNETLLRGIPGIVKSNIELVATLKEASDKFYGDNEDLIPFKKTVAAVFEEISAESPDKPYSEIVEKVGPEVRKRLDLAKEAVSKDKDKDKETKPPNLPKSNKGGKRQQLKPETGSFEEELDAMEAALEED